MTGRRSRAVLRTMITAVLTTLLVLLLGACSGGTDDKRSFPKRPATGLASHLETPPRYSGPGGSPWALDYTPSTQQFLDQFYAVKVQGQVRTRLQQQGLREIVHALWITDDLIQNDIVVLHFATVEGAAEQLNFVQTTNDGNGLLRSYTIDAPGDPVVYYTDQPVSRGLLQAKAYAQYGPYVVEMFTFAPNEIPRGQIDKWMRSQVARLR